MCAADFRSWLADKGINELVLGHNVGARFFGMFFVCAQVLRQLDRLVEFTKLKVGQHEQAEPSWWDGILKWITSDAALLFLQMGTVIHATWGKVFFKLVCERQLSVAAANPYVLQTSNHLTSYAQDPTPCLSFQGRGMDIVRASPLLPAVCAQLRTVFKLIT